MFTTLSNTWKADPDYSARTFRLQMLQHVMRGTLYDVLLYAFDQEQNNQGEYIPLRRRRPSVQINLVRTAVGDAASMLFSEGHFPTAKHPDKDTRAKLARLIGETSLNETYLDAVMKGAPGSVMVLVRVLGKRLFISAHETTYITPTWDPIAPDTLLSVEEKYKVRGQALREAGYAIAEDDLKDDFWLRTVWDRVAETTFIPEKVRRDDDKPIAWTPDPARTVAHHLGFVPISWVKNLPGGDSIDGEPTMRTDAINTNIELDYLLSQNGRGLKYNLDPKLVIKEPAFMPGTGQPIEGEAQQGTPAGGGNAIVLDASGDAKLLELSGSASEAAIGFARYIRELALESLGGNRASAEKLATAQSGKAMELMNQPLVWLADCLRITYGEKSLKDVLQMIIAISHKVPLMFKDGEPVGELTKGNIALVWPDWYAPTPDEMQKKVETLARAVDVGLMSRESAIHIICKLYDIEEVEAEIKLVETMLAERAKEAQTQVQVAG